MSTPQKSIYNEVFISYSRKNMDFAQKIVQAIYETGRENVWIDWEDIEYAEDWWQKIQAGIDSADNFLFILTPDSAQSQVCYDEVEYAVQSGKRIIPIVHIAVTEKADSVKMHPVISQHNWLPFQASDDFDAGMKQLIQTIETDLAHVRFHTRLQTRAREWEQFERNEAYLYSAGELREAQAWLTRAELEEKSPSATDLQREYITASQAAEDERQAEAAQIARRVKNFQRASIGLGTVAVIAIIATVISITAFVQANNRVAEADVRVTEASDRESTAQLQLDDADNNYNTATAIFGTQHAESDDANTQVADAGIRLTQIPPTLNAVNTEVAKQFAVAESLRIAAAAQQEISSGNDELGLALAIEANQIALPEPPPFSQQILANIAYGDIPPHTRYGEYFPDIVPVSVLGASFTPDGQFIISASLDQNIVMWIEGVNYPLRLFEGHDDAITAVAFTPNGQLMVTGSFDTSLLLWDIASGEVLRQYEGHSDGVTGVAVSPDGLFIASASFDNTLLLCYTLPLNRRGG